MQPQMVAPAQTVEPNLTRNVMQKWLLSRSPEAQKMAQNWLEQQDKGARKLKDTKTLVQDGQRVTVNIYDDGSTEVVPFAPDKEKLHFVPMGGKTAAVEPFTGVPQASYIHDPTQDALITDARARQKMEQDAQQFAASQGQQERHFQANYNAPTIQQTDLGPMLIDKRTAVGTPIKDASGNVIESSKALTEVQAKATMFGTRMENASQILTKLESDPEFNPASPVNKLAGATGLNYLAPKKAESYAQARRNWAEAELRFKSGAAVTAAEIDDNVKTYFPIPGDSPEIIAQKAQARQQTEAAMRVAMGKQGEKQMPKPEQQAGAPVAGARRAPDGKWYIQSGNQFLRVEP
jgi:hypothetical protein